jgi:prepilin-type N-terminal cleavage/methylation domain-containing protein
LPSEGFSLVELMVVVAILGLVAAAVAPSLIRMARRNRLRSAAAEIQSTLLAARMRAVKRNQPASVYVVPAAGSVSTHELDTIEADAPSPTPTPSPVHRMLLAGDVVRFVWLPPGQKVTFDGNGRCIWPPASEPTPIVVEGAGSAAPNQITIKTSLTGRVEVVTPAVWQ